MPRGRFITLEGGEGTGKSTLARALAAALEAQGKVVWATREPGGSPGADAIRALVVGGEADRWDAMSEALLFSAARLDHLRRTIRPALDRGAWVICDRYADSTRVYQAARGLDPARIRALADLIGADRPDLTLLLDLDPRAGLARSGGEAKGEDRFERMGHGFHAQVRQGFLDIAREEPERCVVIDSAQPKEVVLAAALAAIEARL